MSELTKAYDMARKLAPKMDERSLGIFMQSRLLDMLTACRSMLPVSGAAPVHHRGIHDDATGFYQRTRRNR